MVEILNAPNDIINSPKNRKNSPQEDSDKWWGKISGFKKLWIAFALIIALWLWCKEKSKNWTVVQNFKKPTPENLKWRKVNDLYSYYLWYWWERFQIWDSLNFNPNEIIQSLYEKKFKKIPSWFEAAKKFYEDTVSKKDFNDFEACNYKILEDKIEESISDINSNFDWDWFWEKMLWWDKDKTKLFKAACNNIDEKCLLAYSMTELFPSCEGELNKNILNFLLQNGWEDFIYYLPAVNDDYASFWPYQFTSLAVYDANWEKRWASIINQFLPQEIGIPWSVVKLVWSDHHKAAYLFAMYNIYTLIKNKNNIAPLNLIKNSKHKGDLTQLIAIMHNKPANGKDFLQEWYKLNTDKKYLDKKTHNRKWEVTYNYDVDKNGSIDLYESKLSPSTSHWYWKKTYYNRRALS